MVQFGNEQNKALLAVARLAVRLIELRRDAKGDSIVAHPTGPPTGGASIARAESAMADLERMVGRLPVGVRREAMRNQKGGA